MRPCGCQETQHRKDCHVRLKEPLPPLAFLRQQWHERSASPNPLTDAEVLGVSCGRKVAKRRID